MKIKFNNKVKGVGTNNKELTKTRLEGADGKLLAKNRYNARTKKDGTEKITAVTKSVDNQGRKVKETIKIVNGKETRSVKVGGKKKGGNRFVAPDERDGTRRPMTYGKGGKMKYKKGRGVGMKKKKK